MADYAIPEDLFYTAEDEWVRRDDDRVVVGVTDYAQQQLGDIVFVELPEVGTRVEKGETFGVIESVKAVSDLYSPVNGEVVDINRDLADRPETINEECYGAGWIIAVATDDDLSALHDAEGYRKYVDNRSE